MAQEAGTRRPPWPVVATLATIVATAALTMAGWVVIDWRTGLRDLENDRRERRIEQLVDSYVHLARAGQGRSLTDHEMQAAEDALTWIQALGTPEQIRVLTELADAGDTDWTRLLDVIRKDLRAQYELPPVDGRIRPFCYPRTWDRENRC